MGSLISMSCFNSRPNSTARIRDSSTLSPQIGQHISIQTYRELSRAPTSSPMSTRTETPLNGENSRSTLVLQEVANRLRTSHTPRF
ncbi:AC4 [Macroptilium bright mosaic virus]|uniref:AC4 n=1 Tax=Macroptilium bright mosaic virus TaxID=1904880 RepID=A0A1D8GV18_9GEMI|nr:AC4 [Macroptilium bright mosaic virus]AOT83395.1 AC4 [Macroptilium bright mosaic virus]